MIQDPRHQTGGHPTYSEEYFKPIVRVDDKKKLVLQKFFAMTDALTRAMRQRAVRVR